MLLGNKQQLAYSNVQVQANASVSNSFELIFMLHERLEQEIDVMVFSIEQNDLEKKSLAAQKSIDILTALDSSLDLNNANDLINNIHNLYEYGIKEIFKASKDLNVDYLIELKKPLSDLKDGWQGMLKQL